MLPVASALQVGPLFVQQSAPAHAVGLGVMCTAVKDAPFLQGCLVWVLDPPKKSPSVILQHLQSPTTCFPLDLFRLFLKEKYLKMHCS